MANTTQRAFKTFGLDNNQTYSILMNTLKGEPTFPNNGKAQKFLCKKILINVSKYNTVHKIPKNTYLDFKITSTISSDIVPKF